MFFLCELLGGNPRKTAESSESRFFTEDQLPELSLSRVLPRQLHDFFSALRAGSTEAKFD